MVLVGLFCLAATAGVAVSLIDHNGLADRFVGGKPQPEDLKSTGISPLDRDLVDRTPRSVPGPAGAVKDRSEAHSLGTVSGVPLTKTERPSREDGTDPVGTDTQQRRQGVSIADWDCDGNLGVLAFLGAAYPAALSFDVLARDPKVHTRWLKIKLIATSSNRMALGAKIRVDLKQADGELRSIFRTIGNNGSFGGNSSVESIGLGESLYVDQMTVTWPKTRKTEVYHKVAPDQFIEITEGSGSYRVIRQKVLAVPVPST